MSDGVHSRPMYPGAYAPTRFWKVGRGAAFDSGLARPNQLARWAPIRFSLGTPKIACDPSNPATWQRPYQFYQGGLPQ
jgi:hypothetical protein